MTKIYQVILDLKALQFACLSAVTQEEGVKPVVFMNGDMNREVQKSLHWAIEFLERKTKQKKRRKLRI